MPSEQPGDYGNGDSDFLESIYGDYDPSLVYEEFDYFNPINPISNTNEEPVMYFDQITTTTVPPDMYDYLFAFDKPSRNRLNGPVRKKFDAQALKQAYAAILQKSQGQERARRVARSLFGEVEVLARQFLQRFTGPKPKILGLLDRRAPQAFRQNTFVKISLSQFSIVSTGTTGKNPFFKIIS